MHDIKLIRKNPEILDRALKKRGENSKNTEDKQNEHKTK